MRPYSAFFAVPLPRQQSGAIAPGQPVKVLNDDHKGVTRDLSPSGVFFETDKHYEVGSIITMTIDLESPPGSRLRCEGTIVRVEDQGSKVGVAIHMKAGESAIV